jgi:hypothetical protein
MKSVITKRWFFIFLIAFLSIRTYKDFREYIVYEYWQHFYVIYYGIIISQILIWYCIIKKSRWLKTAIVIWVCFIILDLISQIPFIMENLNKGRFIIKFCIYFVPYIILLVGGMRYIKTEKISN